MRAGQSLYQIDAAPYRATLASAEAQLQRAQANLVSNNAQLERYQVLIKGNAVSKQAYDNALAAQLQAAADVAAAKAAVTSAGINLAYTNVTAPIGGRSTRDSAPSPRCAKRWSLGSCASHHWPSPT